MDCELAFVCTSEGVAAHGWCALACRLSARRAVTDQTCATSGRPAPAGTGTCQFCGIGSSQTLRATGSRHRAAIVIHLIRATSYQRGRARILSGGPGSNRSMLRQTLRFERSKVSAGGRFLATNMQILANVGVVASGK